MEFVTAIRDECKDVDKLRSMLDGGADINGKVDGKGRPPSLDDGIEEAETKHLLTVAMNQASALHHAANLGDPEVVRLILESKDFTEINALTNAKDKYEDEVTMTALHVAALNGHEKVCCMILEDKRFDENSVNAKIEEGGQSGASRNALALACQKGLPRLFEMLLKDPRCTVDINAEIDNYETTLLMLACCNNTPGNIEICKMFFENPDFTAYTASSCRGAGTKLSGTAQEIATRNGLEEIVKLFQEWKK